MYTDMARKENIHSQHCGGPATFLGLVEEQEPQKGTCVCPEDVLTSHEALMTEMDSLEGGAVDIQRVRPI